MEALQLLQVSPVQGPCLITIEEAGENDRPVRLELHGPPDVLAQETSLQAAKSLAGLAGPGADLLVEIPVAAEHTDEVFEVFDRLQLGAINSDGAGGSVGNCGRCCLKQDLCLAKADGETEEAGGFCKFVDDDLEVRSPYVPRGHSRQQTVLPGQSFSQSLSWLSVGEGQTGSRQADIVGTLPVQGPLMARFSTQVKNRLKRTGASTHPCLTPLEMLKGSDASPSEITCPVMSSWNWRIRFTNLVGHPSLDRITQRASLLTVSKAFIRSMKTAMRSIFCLMHFSCTLRVEKIMSVVLRFGRNPHFASGRFSSEMLVMRRLRMTRARIFPATDRREMPR